MKINVRADSVEIEGYVNAIERNSKPLMSRIGKFIERICKGAFKRALERNDNVRILLNHNWDRDLGGTKDGNLELEEDSIGLHARATITDKEVVESARRGDLVGWSFGFSDRDVENSVENDGTPLRRVKDLDLYEVSLLDRTKTPAYDGTLVTARSVDGQEQVQFRGEEFLDEVEVREDQEKRKEDEKEKKEEEADNEATTETEAIEKSTKIDYTKYENMINKMKED
ncbi:HK97 family phage prohead protease [Megamonas hypermegale]|uniref:HK97 family phage prohead protease n=1 Tax=Megamonas hypermegale TaxID=158847 RepID=UPI0026EA97A3|nr:HK97 family phage prohead protease [Megamonas hypermegale]